MITSMNLYQKAAYAKKQDFELPYICQQPQKCMKYPEYEARGSFVGSGVIESCHRYVMQNRIKQPGQRNTLVHRKIKQGKTG